MYSEFEINFKVVFMKTKKLFQCVMAAILICGSINVYDVSACTNIIVGRKASTDGSVFLSYCADASGWFDPLFYSPAMTHQPGEMHKIYDWDCYIYHGEIPEVYQTWNVVGNTNEWQLTIGESSCYGRYEMVDETGIIDYGSLIYITLQRCKTAREAIKTMVSLVEQYGYYSYGETFSICDPNEAWMLYMNGCGQDRITSPERTVWVALRVPDDAVAAHANYCRLTKFLDGRYTRITLDELDTKYPADGDDVPQLMVCSNNVVNYARKMGWYEGTDADFSYNDVYDSKSFLYLRFCEGRVWSIYNRFANDMDQYLPYASGADFNAEPMPLWVVPKQKVGLKELRAAMRDHYEDTPFANTGINGGWFDTPYSILPYDYEEGDDEYFTERTISTMESAWCFISQMRSWMPRETGCLWFGNDEGNMVAYTPLYNCLTRAPKCFSGEGASETEFSMDNAYWVCNWVSNMIYPRYSMMFPSLQAVRDSLDNSYEQLQPSIEEQALALDADSRVKLLTDYSCQKSDEMIERWRKLAFHLIVKYNDMVIRGTNPDGSFIVNEYGRAADISLPYISDTFTRTHVQVTGDRYRIPEESSEPTRIAPVRRPLRRFGYGTYNPSGVRANPRVRGVYISNGKKQVVK